MRNRSARSYRMGYDTWDCMQRCHFYYGCLQDDDIEEKHGVAEREEDFIQAIQVDLHTSVADVVGSTTPQKSGFCQVTSIYQ